MKSFKYLHYCFHVFAYELFFQNLQLRMDHVSVIIKKYTFTLLFYLILMCKGEGACRLNLMQEI